MRDAAAAAAAAAMRSSTSMTTARATNAPTQGIKSIEVGARVLFALEQGRGPMSLSEVARRAQLHPAKVHRYLVSLVRTGLASQSPSSGLYDLGPAARHLGVEALRRTDAVSVVSAHAVDLRDQTGHTVNVGVWTDAGPTLVRWDTGTHALAIVVRVGSTLPLLDSAVGLVFLAHLPESTTRDLLKVQQRQGTTHTATAAEVRAIKKSTCAEGFGATTDRMIYGISALGAPVFGADGALEVVIGLILPSHQMTPIEARRLGALLVAAAQRASLELGYRNGLESNGV
jgi:DNA-binding IclR family transcriptional regulator